MNTFKNRKDVKVGIWKTPYGVARVRVNVKNKE